MKYSPIFAGLLFMSLILTGCNASVPSGSHTTTVTTTATAATVQTTLSPSESALSALRKSAEEADALFSAAFLGGGDTIESAMESSKMADTCALYPFVAEIPESRQVAHQGGGWELYCIVPTDPEASVVVSKWVIDESNNFTGSAGDILYKSKSGEPILIYGNFSDIMPNLNVLVMDKTGTSLQWQPFMSLRDGYMSVPAGTPSVYDFSLYDYPAE